MILNAGNYQEQVPSWLHLVIGTEGGGEGVPPQHRDNWSTLWLVSISKWRLGSVWRLWLEVSQSPSTAAQVHTPNHLPLTLHAPTFLSSWPLNPRAHRHNANPNPAHPAFCGHHSRGAGPHPLSCFSRGAQGSICSPQGTVNDQTGHLFPVSLSWCASSFIILHPR